MKTVRLDLTLAETNQILEALGQMPYAQVYQLVNKIQQQAESQLSEEQAGEAPGSTEDINSM